MKSPNGPCGVMICVLLAFGGTLECCVSRLFIVFRLVTYLFPLFLTVHLRTRVGAMADIDQDLLNALQVNDETETDDERQGEEDQGQPGPDHEQHVVRVEEEGLGSAPRTEDGPPKDQQQVKLQRFCFEGS